LILPFISTYKKYILQYPQKFCLNHYFEVCVLVKESAFQSVV
jgi:hypothetical protein